MLLHKDDARHGLQDWPKGFLGHLWRGAPSLQCHQCPALSAAPWAARRPWESGSTRPPQRSCKPHTTCALRRQLHQLTSVRQQCCCGDCVESTVYQTLQGWRLYRPEAHLILMP